MWAHDCVWGQAMMCVWKSEDNVVELVVFLLVPEIELKSPGFHNKSHYTVSYQASPTNFVFIL